MRHVPAVCCLPRSWVASASSSARFSALSSSRSSRSRCRSSQGLAASYLGAFFFVFRDVRAGRAVEPAADEPACDGSAFRRLRDPYIGLILTSLVPALGSVLLIELTYHITLDTGRDRSRGSSASRWIPRAPGPWVLAAFVLLSGMIAFLYYRRRLPSAGTRSRLKSKTGFGTTRHERTPADCSRRQVAASGPHSNSPGCARASAVPKSFAASIWRSRMASATRSSDPTAPASRRCSI